MHNLQEKQSCRRRLLFQNKKTDSRVAFLTHAETKTDKFQTIVVDTRSSSHMQGYWNV